MPKVTSLNIPEERVLKLEQQVLEGTPVHEAELADKELAEAIKLIMHKGMGVMQQPVKARQALEQAQTYCIKALSHLVNPNTPSHHKAIAQIANANFSLWKACEALDPEANGLYIEDAFVASSKALKLVVQARDSLAK